MKKFQFSLETMLGYRQQVLESKQQEYATAQGHALTQEHIYFAAQDEYNDFNDEFCMKKAVGMTVVEAMSCESCLRTLEDTIKKEKKELLRLEQVAEERRQEMILAKQDASSAEKLREKKLEDYNKAATKAEEAFIDELVAGTWALNRNSAS
ncbi:MAG: flagellar export protein FliJ [Eubacteriales bacterium]